MLDFIYGVNAFQVIIHGVVHRILAGLQSQTLVPHILERDDFLADLFLGQFLPCDMLVLHMIRTVGASIDTVVGKVQRGEHDDTVSVEILLNLFCQLEYLLVHGGVLTGKKHGGLSVGKSLS